MPWNLSAKYAVFRLYSMGESESAIIKDVSCRFDISDTTVRKCIAALNLITLPDTDARFEERRERFERLDGTNHYLDDTKRSWSQWKNLDSIRSELNLHTTELHQFGIRLRDRLMAPTLNGLDSTGQADDLLLWEGLPSLTGTDPFDNGQGRDFDRDWPLEGPYDAQFHPIFPLFREHLEGHPCWEILEGDLSSEGSKYRRAVRDAYRLVSVKITDKLPGLVQHDVDAIVLSLLTDQFQRLTSPFGRLIFDYTPQRVQVGDDIVWRLVLGAWTVGTAADHSELESLEIVHRSMVESLTSSPDLEPMGAAQAELHSAIMSFQDSLGSDTELRSAILSGLCATC